QLNPYVTTLSNGNFIIVWQSEQTNGGFTMICRQLFDKEGNKINGEFIVNSQTSLFQHYPTAASLPNGNFVVVWGSYLGINLEAAYDVKGQIFKNDGEKLGKEFQVNVETLEIQDLPKVTSLT